MNAATMNYQAACFSFIIQRSAFIVSFLDPAGRDIVSSFMLNSRCNSDDAVIARFGSEGLTAIHCRILFQSQDISSSTRLTCSSDAQTSQHSPR